MTYLSPLNRNNLDARSEISEIFANISDQALSDSKISNLLTKLGWKERSLSVTKSFVAFSALSYTSYTRILKKEDYNAVC